jgi:formate hydrogenlyase subunit 4
MAVILNLAVQAAQMLLVLALAPLLTGFVRKVKARLLLRQGPPLIQPYRDLARLLRSGSFPSRADKPCRSAFRREFFFPATVRGPVLF